MRPWTKPIPLVSWTACVTDAVMNMAEVDKSVDNVTRKDTSSLCVRTFLNLQQIMKILQ